jgi:hypothetical protein
MTGNVYSTNNEISNEAKYIHKETLISIILDLYIHRRMRCIAANRSVLTTLDQNTTFGDDNGSNCTAMTNDIQCSDIIQFADGWYSYPDLNTFDSDLLLDVLTIRVNIYLLSRLFLS